MINFINGAVAMGFAVSGLCFLRFWRESRDRLFCLFAIGFLLLAANRFIRLQFEEDGPSLIPYIVRLFAFTIIIGAIVDKNLRRG